MIKLINGKTYNTDTATYLFEQSVYSGGGNYTGENSLCATPKGALFVHYSSNGQDCHRAVDIHAVTPTEALEWLSGREITGDEMGKLSAHLDFSEA